MGGANHRGGLFATFSNSRNPLSWKRRRRLNRAVAAVVEPLETRTLLSVTIDSTYNVSTIRMSQANTVVADFSDSDPYCDPSTLSATINWGDIVTLGPLHIHDTTSGTIISDNNGGFIVYGAHSPRSNNGTYNASVTITDSDDEPVTGHFTLTITGGQIVGTVGTVLASYANTNYFYPDNGYSYGGALQNPDGAWSFGSEQAPSVDFTPLNTAATLTDPAGNTIPALGCGPYPNDLTSPVAIGAEPDGTFFMQGGGGTSGAGYAVARFTAPIAGKYYLSASFNAGESQSDNNDIEVLLDGQQIYQTTLNSSIDDLGVTLPQYQLAAGDTIDVAVAGSTGTLASLTVVQTAQDIVAPLPGYTVFSDANNNGTLDSGEASLTTNSGGAFSFSNLAAGTYHIAEQLPSGVTATGSGPELTINGVTSVSSAVANFFDQLPTDPNVSVTAASLSGSTNIPLDEVVATFTDSAWGISAADFSSTISWGDGNSSPGIVMADGIGTFVVVGENTYTSTGAYNAAVFISSPNGAVIVNPSVNVTDGTISATPMTITAKTGVAFSGDVVDFTDVDPTLTASDFTASINWGVGNASTGTIIPDGSGGFDVTGSHTFSTAGAYSGVVRINQGSTTFTLADIAPTVTDTGIAVTGVPVAATQGESFTGTVATIATYDGTESASDFTATINWGDGNTSTGTVIPDPSGGFDVTGFNTYAGPGNYTATVAVEYASTSLSTTAQAAVADDQLTVTTGSISGSDNTSLSGTLADFTDGNDNSSSLYTATIDWGDGQTSVGTIASDGSGGFTVTGSNTYTVAGSYAPEVDIYVNGVQSAAVNAAVTVTDPYLSVTASAISVTAYDDFNGTVATFTDSNPDAGTITATIDWGNGDTETGTITQSGSTYTVSGEETFSETGNVAPTVTITDSGGSAAAATSALTVNASGSATADEGQAYTLQLDPAGADTTNITSWSINWGDGDTQTVTGNPSTVNHTFASGTPSASVVATAFDGSTALQTAAAVPVIVTPAAPTDFQAVWADSATVDLSWTNNSSIGGSIEIEDSTDGGNTFTTLATVSAGATSYAVTSADPSSGAIYAVITTNGSTGAASTQPTADPGPAAPTLSGTAVSTSEIDLTYTDPGGNPLELEELGPGDLNFAFTPAGLNTGAGTHTLQMTGLIEASEYSFRIRAVRNGLVKYSGAISVSTLDSADTLPTPTIVSIKRVRGDDPYLYKVKFTESDIDPTSLSDTPYGLFLYEQTSNDPLGVFYQNGASLQTKVGSNSSFVTLVCGTTDEYAVEFEVYAAAGESATVRLQYTGPIPYSTGTSPLSNGAGVTGFTGDADHPPAGELPPTLTLSEAPAGAGLIALTASGMDGYTGDIALFEWYDGHVQIPTNPSSDNGYAWSSSTPTITVSSLPSGGQFFVVASGVSYDNNETVGDGLFGAYSNLVDGGSGGGISAPTAPGGLTATVTFDNPAIRLTDNHVRLVWNNSSNNESGFEVLRKLNGSNSEPDVVAELPADETSFIDTGMKPGDYTYYVFANNGAGGSDAQIDVNVSPPGHLVAFDGTNLGRENNDDIWKFEEAYPHADNAYFPGVGVSENLNGRASRNLLAAISGASMYGTVLAAYSQLVKFYNEPGSIERVPLDIIGDSRGAIEAVALANIVATKGIPIKATGKTSYSVVIRYVGLISPVSQQLFEPVVSIATLGNFGVSLWPMSLPFRVIGSFQALDNHPNDIIYPEINISGVTATGYFNDDHLHMAGDPAVLSAMIYAAQLVDSPEIPLASP